MIDLFWVCYGEYQGSRKPKLFFRYFGAKIVEMRKEQTYMAYMTYGIQSICGFKKSWEELIKVNRKAVKDDDREPEQVINSIKEKLKGNKDERTDFSGNTDPE